MARNAADLDRAIEGATDLFWRRGYDETSIEDVVNVTGFNRYALYNAFGGKREIFIAALDTYCDTRRNIFMETLEAPGAAPLDAIRKVFEFSIGEAAKRNAGCLICDIGGDIARTDPIIAERRNEYLKMIETAHIGALRRAEERGELNPAISPEEGGALLMTFLLGTGAHAKSGATKKRMLTIFRSLMAVISNDKNLSHVSKRTTPKRPIQKQLHNVQ